MNGVGAALRSVAMVPAFAGNGNFIFGIAFTLGYNAPVRACNVHNNGKISLLRKLCHNAFGSRAAAFFFSVGVVNDFFIIVKTCFFQRREAVNNFHNRCFIIAYARAPGKAVFIHAEGAFGSFAAFKHGINMRNQKRCLRALALKAWN